MRREIEQILSNGDFDASRRSRDFLRFIVDEALAGRGDDLTQASIATRVFGRRDDFDPVVDPIVRIQAGRLRRSLERYYLLSGKHDPVRIQLPRGTYVPAFRAHAESEAANTDHPEPPAAPAVVSDEWPSILVYPFELAGGNGHEEPAARLNDELSLELGRHRYVRVLLPDELARLDPSRRERARFSLGGRIRANGGDLRVTAHLVDRETGEQVWGDEYQTTPKQGGWSGTPEDIARVMAARVGGEEGVLIQRLVSERRKRCPAAVTPYGAILLSFEFFLARDPHSVGPALEALRRVVQTEPECGVAWTRLARLCLANHVMEVTPIPTPVDEAITRAHNGVRLEPSSRHARCVLAAGLLIKGELDAARDELHEAYRLSPDSLVWLEMIGWLLAMVGDGERGAALIRSARERNPHCLPNAAMGLWFHHLRRGEFELAYKEALEHRDPTYFWRGVMRLSCLGHLGRAVEAAAERADLLQRKPDFESRGRILIGHFLKLPGALDLVVDGLARAGVKLA